MHDGGLGDIELSTKISPPPVGKMFYQGYLISGTLPTGMKKNGLFPRHAYYLDNNVDDPAESFYSASNPTIKGLILLTFDIGAHEPKIPVVIHANAGGVFTVSDERQRNTVIGSLALEYSPIYFLTLFTDLYGEEYFIRLLGNGYPATKAVRGSNFCDLGWHIDKRLNRITVLSAIDNLVKGAAGQAVQNMNVLFGLPENTGLKQVPLYP
jgi:hypothetical protein